MKSIAIVDPFGFPYDGNTLKTRGLGGSESSVIYMAKELTLLGYDVTVFNNCKKSGIYDGVTYEILNDIGQNYDIVISLRSVLPFLDTDLQRHFRRGLPLPEFNLNARLKILWKHDTFCQGDEILAALLLSKSIDTVFTLSDWHTQHTMEKLEVPKDKIFQTRNGYNHFNVNMNDKKSNQFVYNAASYKGLVPLVEEIWPQVLNQIPQAKLVVIGGWYDGAGPDDALKSTVEKLQRNHENITFTGIITPEEAASIVAESMFFIYPPTFPETFGISTLEAIAYKTLPITVNYGALTTTAIDDASFKLQNSAYTINEFVELTVLAYEHRDKLDDMYSACEQVRDTCTWDKVALEWQQFFNYKLNTKSILIAVPTDRYVEPETFQSIYGLHIPNGYKTDFKFFKCDLVDQNRNNVAHYALQHEYDYVFYVDSDIILPPDTLKKLISHDKEFVCGMYRMRRDEEVLEVYDTNYILFPSDKLKSLKGVIEIGGCGFGCVLLQTGMLRSVDYPQFAYHQAFSFDGGFSEDMDFCQKARNKNHRLFCDTSIKCEHIGTTMVEFTDAQ